MEETEKAKEARVKAAERAHDRDFKAIEIHNRQIEVFSIAAMRGPALVAAGGVAASLGFYSANYSRLVDKPTALLLFNDTLTWLFAGLLLTLLAPGLAYFSQIAYLDSVAEHRHTWDHPYVTAGRRSKIGERIGDVLRWSCVLFVLASIAAVGVGGAKFLKLVATL